MASLPGWMGMGRQMERGPKNPMDKATIVSIYPRRVHETKVTIEPGVFLLPPGSYDEPSTLVVGTSSWWREIDHEQPMLEIPVPSVQVANSVIRDYCIGLLECDMESRKPGLFYVPGSFSSAEIKKNHKALLDLALVKQNEWFKRLVFAADVLWARTNGNPLAVPDLARLAARELNLTEKDWLRDSHTLELVKCIACAALISKAVIVCPNCKVIVDQKRFKESNLQFAGTGQI